LDAYRISDCSMCGGRWIYEVIRVREIHFLHSDAYDMISDESSEMFLVSPNGSTFSLSAWVCAKIYMCV